MEIRTAQKEIRTVFNGGFMGHATITREASELAKNNKEGVLDRAGFCTFLIPLIPAQKRKSARIKGMQGIMDFK